MDRHFGYIWINTAAAASPNRCGGPGLDCVLAVVDGGSGLCQMAGVWERERAVHALEFLQCVDIIKGYVHIHRLIRLQSFGLSYK